MTVNNFYDGFHKKRKIDKFIKYRLERISRYIDSGSVLDVGGGSGTLYSFLKHKKIDYFLNDLSDHALKIAKKSGINCKKQNLEKPFKLKRKFDYVVASEVFEHLFCPMVTLNEIHKVLKNDGTFICSFPNDHSFSADLYFMRMENIWEHPHIRNFRSVKHIKKFLDIGGFRPIKIEKLGAFPLIHKFIPLNIVSEMVSIFSKFVSNWIVVCKKK